MPIKENIRRIVFCALLLHIRIVAWAMQYSIDNHRVSIVFGFEYSLPNLRTSSLEHSRTTFERASFVHEKNIKSNSLKLPLTVFQNTKLSSHKFAEKLNEETKLVSSADDDEAHN